MKKILKYYWVVLVAMLTTMMWSALSAESVHALEATLTVSPMEQRMTLYPGETSTGSIRVSNQASAKENLYYKVSVVPFTRFGDNYDPMVGNELAGGEYNNIIEWVTLSSDSGVLAPNEQDEIIYTIDVPEDVRGGGQYFAILVARTEDPNEEKKEGNATLKEIIQIASTIYASVSGKDIQLSGTISENNIPTFLLAPPIKASFKVENTGNTHMELNYYMQVFPLFSEEEIYTNEEDPSFAIVLPETTRYVSQEWSETPQIGIFKVRQTVVYDSNGENKSVTEKIVIICPIWLLFIVIFAIAALIIWLVLRSKTRKSGSRRGSTED